MTTGDEPVNLAEGDWPDDETLDPRSPSAPTAAAPPVGGAPVGGAPVGGAPVGRAPVGRAPVGRAPVGRAPVGRVPAPVPTARPGVSPTVRWVAVAAAAFGVAVLSRRLRNWLLRHRTELQLALGVEQPRHDP